jgi:threonine aldolase
VGSALVGPEDTIERARKFRKIFGGGMRQAGIIAAGALYALENNIARLKEDHDKAKVFAERIAGNPRLIVDMRTVQTNMVVFDITKTGKSTDEVLATLRSKNVALSDANYTSLRAVTHMNVSLEQVKKAAEIVAETF